jgi:hypothetical protein
MAGTHSHRQLLVRCRVRNRAGEVSKRFVEHQLFRLWQYMMANKHGLRVEHVDLGLWIPEGEWMAQRTLFEQSGPREDVQRISVAIYDPASGVCDTLQRFVPAEDAEHVKTLLLARLTGGRTDADHVMELAKGVAIIRTDVADLATLGQPLWETRPA